MANGATSSRRLRERRELRFALTTTSLNRSALKSTPLGGGSYQALINEALRQYIESKEEPFNEAIRSVVREELNRYGANQRANLTKRSSGRDAKRAAAERKR